MEEREFAGKLDYLIFILVLLGVIYFLTSGYPFYLQQKVPLLDEPAVRILASGLLLLGMGYTLFVIVTSFVSSVRKLETIVGPESEGESEKRT